MLVRLLFLLTTTLLVLTACSSGSSSRNDKNQFMPEPVQFFPTQALTLDFTFPLGDNADTLIGFAVDLEADVGAILTAEGELILLTLTGDLIGVQTIDLSEVPVDITIIDGDLIIAGEGGSVWAFDLDDQTLELLTQFADALSAIGQQDGELFAMTQDADNAYQIRRVVPGATDTAIDTDERFVLYDVQGMDVFGAQISVLAIEESTDTPVVIQLGLDGSFIEAWTLSAAPAGLALLDESVRGPTLFTVNNDAERTVRLFEPAPVAGQLDEPSLDVLRQVELGEDGVAQPSGLDFYENMIYIVTDFGIVARANADATGLETLFEIDALQGTFESIDVNAAGDLEILGVDEEDRPVIYTYDILGTLLDEAMLVDEEIVIEGMERVGDERFWVNHAEGEKVLYRQIADGPISATSLGAAYDEYLFSGLAVADDNLLLVTDQREASEDVLAGLLIIWNVDSAVEVARYSIAAEDGTGLIHPSAIAVNPVDGFIYVAADTDDGELVAYDFDDD